MSTERGSGRTTRQMLEAPQGATYVWCNSHLMYPKLLARFLRRQDLVIVSPGALEASPQLLRGVLDIGMSAIVVDHACELTQRQQDYLHEIEIRLKHYQQIRKYR